MRLGVWKRKGGKGRKGGGEGGREEERERKGRKERKKENKRERTKEREKERRKKKEKKRGKKRKTQREKKRIEGENGKKKRKEEEVHPFAVRANTEMQKRSSRHVRIRHPESGALLAASPPSFHLNSVGGLKSGGDGGR